MPHTDSFECALLPQINLIIKVNYADASLCVREIERDNKRVRCGEGGVHSCGRLAKNPLIPNLKQLNRRQPEQHAERDELPAERRVPCVIVCISVRANPEPACECRTNSTCAHTFFSPTSWLILPFANIRFTRVTGYGSESIRWFPFFVQSIWIHILSEILSSRTLPKLPQCDCYLTNTPQLAVLATSSPSDHRTTLTKIQFYPYFGVRFQYLFGHSHSSCEEGGVKGSGDKNTHERLRFAW